MIYDCLDIKQIFEKFLYKLGYIQIEGYKTSPLGDSIIYGELTESIPKDIKLMISSKLCKFFSWIDEDYIINYVFNYDRKRTNRRI